MSYTLSRRSLVVYYTEAAFAICFLLYALSLATIGLHETCLTGATIMALLLFPEFKNLPRITVLFTMLYIANTSRLSLVTDTGERVEGEVAVSLLTLTGLVLATIKGLC